MKLPDESEVTADNYQRLGKEYTKDWKRGDQIKVLYKPSNDPKHGYHYWAIEMDQMIGKVGTLVGFRSEYHVDVQGLHRSWFFPWYVLENVSRKPAESDRQTKAINDLKTKMDLLTKGHIV